MKLAPTNSINIWYASNSKSSFFFTDTKTDRERERERDRQTDRERETDRETEKQIEKVRVSYWVTWQEVEIMI